MVYGDLVSFPFPHLCFPSSPHTPGIITPCGINTQLKFYFLLISFLLSLSHIHMLSSLCPLCLSSSLLCLFSHLLSRCLSDLDYFSCLVFHSAPFLIESLIQNQCNRQIKHCIHCECVALTLLPLCTQYTVEDCLSGCGMEAVWKTGLRK